MSRFASQENYDNVSPISKTLEPGTVQKVTLAKAEYGKTTKKQTEYIKLIYESYEPVEGLDNPKQPAGNKNFQYCENTFWLTDKCLAIKNEKGKLSFLSITNHLYQLAATLGLKDKWDEKMNEVDDGEELAEAIEQILSNKPVMASIAGTWESFETEEGTRDYCRPSVSNLYGFANPEDSKGVANLVKFVSQKMSEGSWIRDTRVPRETTSETPVTPETTSVQTDW